ncbi:MAG: glucosaminidase domain-containing protein [Bacteroidales bacterium]|nr:glucosaminidase domain-containing protein [Bacteroidales bacterium]
MNIIKTFLKQPRRGKTHEVQLTPRKQSAEWGRMIYTVRTTICIVGILAAATAGHAQYNEQDIRNYIEQYADVAIQKMQEYKIPASITIAQGIFESACGKSRLAVEGNNHFGIKCHNEWTGDTILIDDDELQECFRKYTSVSESYNDHSLFLTTRKRYANLFELDIMDYQAWARTLKQDGYATNPQYADRLISLIERFNIAKLDTLYLQQYGDSTALAQNKPIVQNKPTKPEKQTAQQSSQSTTDKHGKKVFTAIGSEYPSDQSPFTYRKVFKNNNTYFVIAEKGDTYEKIAQDILVMADNLRKFNDASATDEPMENEIVYVEAKAHGNPARVHTVQAGETLRYISQRYGVQLRYILKYNMLDENSVIHPGDQILLRR